MSKFSIKNFMIHKILCANYGESLLISFRAFLPSLRVLNTSQERKEIISIVSEIREKKVLLKLIAI